MVFVLKRLVIYSSKKSKLTYCVVFPFRQFGGNVADLRRIAPAKWQFQYLPDEVWDESSLPWSSSPNHGQDCASVGEDGLFVSSQCDFVTGSRIICETDASGMIELGQCGLRLHAADRFCSAYIQIL